MDSYTNDSVKKCSYRRLERIRAGQGREEVRQGLISGISQPDLAEQLECKVHLSVAQFKARLSYFFT